MRKPRDYDAELKALDDKTKDLRTRRLRQLGELVIGTGADALEVDVLAGALLSAAQSKDSAQREAWRLRGATFFRRGSRNAASGNGGGAGSSAPAAGATQPSAS